MVLLPGCACCGTEKCVCQNNYMPSSLNLLPYGEQNLTVLKSGAFTSGRRVFPGFRTYYQYLSNGVSNAGATVVYTAEQTEFYSLDCQNAEYFLDGKVCSWRNFIFVNGLINVVVSKVCQNAYYLGEGFIDARTFTDVEIMGLGSMSAQHSCTATSGTNSVTKTNANSSDYVGMRLNGNAYPIHIYGYSDAYTPRVEYDFTITGFTPHVTTDNLLP